MSWVAAAVAGSAIVGGIISGVSSANAARSAANTAEDARNAQLEYLRQNRVDIADAIEKGLVDLDTGYSQAMAELKPMVDAGKISMEDYQQLLRDPSAIMNRASTQFQYNQGMKALDVHRSRSVGGGMSGGTLKAAIEYGQNFASQNLDAELARLTPLMNMGQQASSNMAALYSQQGTAKANLRLGGQNQLTSNSGMAVNAIGNAGNQMAGYNAAGIMGVGNAATGTLSNLSNIGTNYAAGMFSQKY